MMSINLGAHCGTCRSFDAARRTCLLTGCFAATRYYGCSEWVSIPDLLAEASAVINGERQDQYGAPENSFVLIAQYWNVYLISRGKAVATANGVDPDSVRWVETLRPRDVAQMMVLFKLAREAHQHKRDNLVDAAGYLAIAADRLGENGE